MLSACLLMACASLAGAGDPQPPRVLDPALEIALVAHDPDLVTPVGVAVDAAGRVLVVESHTHFRPENYEGPPADRILEFADADGDGRYESRRVVFEGSRQTMGLAVEPDQSLLVATRREIFRLRRDAAGSFTTREDLAHLVSEGDYPHNGLSGFAREPDGTILFGLGENLGEAYTLRAADGTKWTGGGEGGSVFRMRPDGGHLERVATGFWNPFGLALDPFGRLFAVDNDPDSRPPCRLLHVVEGGDYGYRFRNGRRGLHPFTSWDGELAGTLPMAAGTGEAPSGILVEESGHPVQGATEERLLVTSWGDHAIERYDLEPVGATVRGRRSIVVQGGETFRPVGIARAPDGSIFVTDWVDRSYTLHGKGRLWRLRARASNGAAPAHEGAASEPASLDSPSAEGRALAIRRSELDLASLRGMAAPEQPAVVRFEALRKLADPAAWPEIREGLRSVDPFLRHAAQRAFVQSIGRDRWPELARDADPAIRLAALLALRDSTDAVATAGVLPALLRDADPAIRLAAVQWVVEEGLDGFRDDVRAGMGIEPLSERLFAAYLVALGRPHNTDSNALDQERPDPVLCADLAADATLPVGLRVKALRVAAAEPNGVGLTPVRLHAWLSETEPTIRLEAVRLLARRATDEDLAQLAAIARDPSSDEELQAEAVGGLAVQPERYRRLLAELVESGPPAVRHQAARGLRDLSLSRDERAAVERGGESGLLERLESLPDSALADEWVESPGDPAEGARIFFHPQGPKCATCHQVDGRGERIGPDLTGFAATATPARLLESIITPGREVAPQFTLWRVERSDGRTVEGMLLADRDDVQIYRDNTGHDESVPTRDVETRTPLPASLMPSDLHRTMSRGELRDLLAFLRASAGIPTKTGRIGP